jgi:hypothetical protein
MSNACGRPVRNARTVEIKYMVNLRWFWVLCLLWRCIQAKLTGRRLRLEIGRVGLKKQNARGILVICSLSAQVDV